MPLRKSSKLLKEKHTAAMQAISWLNCGGWSKHLNNVVHYSHLQVCGRPARRIGLRLGRLVHMPCGPCTRRNQLTCDRLHTVTMMQITHKHWPSLYPVYTIPRGRSRRLSTPSRTATCCRNRSGHEATRCAVSRRRGRCASINSSSVDAPRRTR